MFNVKALIRFVWSSVYVLKTYLAWLIVVYIYIYDHKHPTSAYLYAVYVFVFSVLYFSVRNFPIANVGRYPGRKPAATESRYPAVSNFKRSEELPGVT